MQKLFLGGFRSDCVEGIKQKVGVVETLCSALQKFAEAITTITANILALDVDKILSNVADISRMLQLSDMLGQFATEMLKLIECVSEVFHAVMEKIENAIPNLGEFAVGNATIMSYKCVINYFTIINSTLFLIVFISNS